MCKNFPSRFVLDDEMLLWCRMRCFLFESICSWKRSIFKIHALTKVLIFCDVEGNSKVPPKNFAKIVQRKGKSEETRWGKEGRKKYWSIYFSPCVPSSLFFLRCEWNMNCSFKGSNTRVVCTSRRAVPQPRFKYLF